MSARRRARLWRTVAVVTSAAFVGSVWPAGSDPVRLQRFEDGSVAVWQGAELVGAYCEPNALCQD